MTFNCIEVKALGRNFPQAPLHKVYEFLGHAHSLWKCDFFVNDTFFGLECGVRIEGKPVINHAIEHYADRPDINGWVS